MKRWMKTAAAAALCAALLLCGAIGGTVLPAGGSTSTVYLMAVNEKVVPLTAENMPMMVNGTLYVPYIMLSSRTTEINLRVTALYSTTRRTLLVSGGQKGVTFDTRANTAYDIQGEALDVRAAVRNSMVFIPVDWLCSYFDAIDYSLIPTQYGTLVRITNGDAILSDAEFADAAKGKLAENLQKYLDSIAPSATPTPSPTTAQPSSAPSPTPSPTPTPTPSLPPVPSSAPSLPPEESAELYLALRWGEQGAQAARILEDRGLRGLFLFAPEELAGQGGAVRRLVGAGHTIGLDLTGTDTEACLEQVARGRALLADAVRCDTAIVSAAGADREVRAALREAGYVLWSPTVLGGRYASGEALSYGLDPDRVNYVELTCGEGSAAFLRAALDAMEDAGCTVYQPTAPSLS